MVVCPDCGKDVKDAKFCSNCGALLPKVEEAVENVENDVVEEAVAEVGEVAEEETAVVEEENDATVEDPVEEVEKSDISEGETIEVKTAGSKSDNDTVNKSKFCPNCGTEITADVAFCPQCGFKLHKDETQTKFCQNCGKKIDINAEICPHCGVRVAGVTPSGEKSVLLAAILSFLFPGLGHLYNGLTTKGLSFIIAYIVSAVLIFLIVGFVLMLIVWIWALVDVIKTTEAINRGEAVEDKLF